MTRKITNSFRSQDPDWTTTKKKEPYLHHPDRHKKINAKQKDLTLSLIKIYGTCETKIV